MQFLILIGKIWGWLAPFVKEMFYGKYQFANYFAERKLTATLLVAVIIYTLLLAYMVEQAIALTKEVISRNERIELLQTEVDALNKTSSSKDMDVETVPKPMDVTPEPPMVDLEPEPIHIPQPIVQRPRVYTPPKQHTEPTVEPKSNPTPKPQQKEEEPAVRSNLRSRMNELTLEDL